MTAMLNALSQAAADFIRSYCGDDVAVKATSSGFGCYVEPARGEEYARIVVEKTPGPAHQIEVRIAAHVPKSYYHRRSSPQAPGRYGYVEPQLPCLFDTVGEAVRFLRSEAQKVRDLRDIPQKVDKRRRS